jgi:A/G-specific adenine glycosylase
MNLSQARVRTFRRVIYSHFSEHGRALPWRNDINPYRVYISEIMLQQTQVDRVIVKYPAFITTFRDFKALERAPLASVLAAWQGLGYNRRALLLKEAAHRIITGFKGVLPQDPETLRTLPGIGKATSCSIAAFAFNRPAVFIETNIRSVFIHHFFKDTEGISDDQIEPLVQCTLDKEQPGRWYSALMDYGSELKKRVSNPSRKSRHYSRQSRFEGSKRQARGKILKQLLANGPLTLDALARATGRSQPEIRVIINDLVAEGFAEKKKNHFTIKG